MSDWYISHGFHNLFEWAKHKYIRKEGNRYIYPEDLQKQRMGTAKPQQPSLMQRLDDAKQKFTNYRVEHNRRLNDKDNAQYGEGKGRGLINIGKHALKTAASALVPVAGPVLLAKNVVKTAQAPYAYVREQISDYRKGNAPKDKKTGFALKTKEWSKDEDMRAVNPGFHNLDPDTKMNCMYCTNSYELRRRGYDVTADTISKTRFVKDQEDWFDVKDSDISYMGPKSLEFDIDSNPTLNFDANSQESKEVIKKACFGRNYDLGTNFEKEILSKYPEGARGNLMMQAVGCGHSIVWEVEGGKVVIRDCQSGKKYEPPSKILRYGISLKYCRLDDKKVNYNKIKEVVA